MFPAAFALILAIFLVPADAHAYLDPATIAMVFQVIVAGAVGAFIFLRGGLQSTKETVLGIFKSKKKTENPSKEN